MKNDKFVGLRLPSDLCEALCKISIKIYGKEQFSRLVRLVLDKYVSEVMYEDNKTDIDNKL